MRSNILCVRCNKLLNSQKSTIKIVSIISCQQAMRAFINAEPKRIAKKKSTTNKKNNSWICSNTAEEEEGKKRKLSTGRVRDALLHSKPKRSQIERSLCGVFWPLQSLKIHLMLPPYVINYHFCLTLFSAPSVLGAHQSHPLCALVHRAAFFRCCCCCLCSIICHGLVFFSFSCCGGLVCIGLQLILFLSALNPEVDRLCWVAIHCWIHIVHMHWYISKFMTWLIFFFELFFPCCQNTKSWDITPHEWRSGKELWRSLCVWERKRDWKGWREEKNRQNSEWPLMSESKTITARQTGIRMKMNNLYPLNDIRPMLPVKFFGQSRDYSPIANTIAITITGHSRRLVSTCYGMIIRAHSALGPTLSIDGFLLSVGMSW